MSMQAVPMAGGFALEGAGELQAVLGDWRAGGTEWTRALAALPLQACFLELAPVTGRDRHTPVRAVALDAPALARVRPDPRAFEEHFGDAPVACFGNLRGDAWLVVPTPRSGPSPHLLAFLRRAPPDHAAALWQAVADAVERRLGDRPLWVSTHGMGVPWLHVRLDDRPKYYRHRPFRSAPR